MARVKEQKELENSLDSFEKKIEFAKETLEKLSDPEVTLNQSMQYYKDGMKELKEASKLLENAKMIYEEIEAK